MNAKEYAQRAVEAGAEVQTTRRWGGVHSFACRVVQFKLTDPDEIREMQDACLRGEARPLGGNRFEVVLGR